MLRSQLLARAAQSLAGYLFGAEVTTLPYVTILSPQNGASVSGTTVVSAVFSGPGFVSAKLLIDGTQLASTTLQPISFTFDADTLSAGSHSVTVSVRYRKRRGVYRTASSTTTVLRDSPGNILWAGDFETGDFSQWTFKLWSNEYGGENDPSTVGHTKGSIVTTPSQRGNFAYKAECFDTTGTGTPSDRVELVSRQVDAGGYPGQAWYYGWWSYFPGPSQTWWAGGADWNDIIQFGSNRPGAWIYLGINATGSPVKIHTDGPTWAQDLATLQYDRWFHFVVHAFWSTNPQVGLFEIWIDDSKVFSQNAQTLEDTTISDPGIGTSPGTHINLGCYRSPSTFTNTVIHDGLCRANTYAAAAGH